MEKLTEMIRAQQQGREGTDVFCVGEQLLDIASESDEILDILKRDLEIAEMSLERAAGKIKEYADKNRKNAKCFCVTPLVADGILREFYGLPERGAKPESAPAESTEGETFIDLGDFL
jgi:hypothetical protein